ncbi:hypothetical protein PI125_g13702 [Phytophthora idaei]|nr:hypothetical protein PI125_g13702 [Phytophthora idaei]KAG3147891.1 hypothetical protein PI126_g12684 [Phytophthora idaei]
MQNFSRDVAVPEAQAPFSVDDITAALSSLQTYCTTFMATEVGDLVRSLHAFAQQEIPQIWPVKDLQHFVFWIDGVLEAFREATVHDLHGGGETRRTIQATVDRNNPDFQATVQLLTQRRLQDLLRHGPLQLQPRQASRTRVVEAAETGRRRQDQSRYRPASCDAPNHLQHVPRQGNLELCLRSLSRNGCVGVPGDPSRCVYPNRCHFTPAAIHDEMRAYIDQRLGGLSPDFRHL